jgi:hypothetical protein
LPALVRQVAILILHGSDDVKEGFGGGESYIVSRRMTQKENPDVQAHSQRFVARDRRGWDMRGAD